MGNLYWPREAYVVLCPYFVMGIYALTPRLSDHMCVRPRPSRQHTWPNLCHLTKPVVIL